MRSSLTTSIKPQFRTDWEEAPAEYASAVIDSSFAQRWYVPRADLVADAVPAGT